MFDERRGQKAIVEGAPVILTDLANLNGIALVDEVVCSSEEQWMDKPQRLRCLLCGEPVGVCRPSSDRIRDVRGPRRTIENDMIDNKFEDLLWQIQQNDHGDCQAKPLRDRRIGWSRLQG